MSDFELYNQALEEYISRTSSPETGSDSGMDITHDEVVCYHDSVVIDGGMTVCLDCDQEIRHGISYEKEWKFRKTGRSSDPSRVHIRNTHERTIYKDVEGLGFGDKIIIDADKLYSQITNGQIFRGSKRKGIIFACVFHAYKTNGVTQSCEKLIKVFNITKKVGLGGLKFVNLNISTDSDIRSNQITPVHLIKEIMEKFSANEKQVENALKIYKEIENRSSLLNRSRPQSVAAGLTYYWLRLKDTNISMKDFTEKIGLSELTVIKMANEIARVH